MMERVLQPPGQRYSRRISRRWRTLTEDGEAGAETIQFAFVALAVMVIFLGLLTVAVWYHAQNTVLAAAQDGARAAAVEGGSATAGRQRAVALLRVGLGNRAAAQATVDVERGEDRTTATVAVPLSTLLPVSGGLTVRATGNRISERFRPQGEAASP